jgi:hypothetical protein
MCLASAHEVQFFYAPLIECGITNTRTGLHSVNDLEKLTILFGRPRHE